MPDFIEFDYTSIRLASPSGTTALAEGSEVFRTVMEDFVEDNDSRHSNDNTENINIRSRLPRRCDNRKACVYKNVRQMGSRTSHTVHWADEVRDGQLTRVCRVDYDSPPSTCSNPADIKETCTMKSILKYRPERANCVIIVGD